MEIELAKIHFEQAYQAWQKANQQKTGVDIGEFEFIEMLWGEYCIARDRFLNLRATYPKHEVKAKA